MLSYVVLEAPLDTAVGVPVVDDETDEEVVEPEEEVVETDEEPDVCIEAAEEEELDDEVEAEDEELPEGEVVPLFDADVVWRRRSLNFLRCSSPLAPLLSPPAPSSPPLPAEPPSPLLPSPPLLPLPPSELSPPLLPPLLPPSSLPPGAGVSPPELPPSFPPGAGVSPPASPPLFPPLFPDPSPPSLGSGVGLGELL